MSTVDLRLLVDDAREMDDQAAREIEEALRHADDEQLNALLREIFADQQRLVARLRDASRRARLLSASADRTAVR